MSVSARSKNGFITLWLTGNKSQFSTTIATIEDEIDADSYWRVFKIMTLIGFEHPVTCGEFAEKFIEVKNI